MADIFWLPIPASRQLPRMTSIGVKSGFPAGPDFAVAGFVDHPETQESGRTA